MGFNEETLEPTYLLRTGSPGKSAGLDIASRLGLPKHLIDRARSAMSTTERDIALFLNRLEEKVSEATVETERLRQLELELKEREQKLLRDMEKKAAQRMREIESRSNEAQKRFEDEATRVIDQVLSNSGAAQSGRTISTPGRPDAPRVSRVRRSD